MRNSTKKCLLTMLLAVIVILPWTQPNTDPKSVTENVSHEQNITCYSTQNPPPQKPIIIHPNL